MENTTNQIRRTKDHWSDLAGDIVEVEAVAGAVYGFGSEIACRRLADRLRAGRVGYSQNIGSWFFVNR